MGLEIFDLALEITRGLLMGRGDTSVEEGLTLDKRERFRVGLEAKVAASILVVLAMDASGVLGRNGTNEPLGSPPCKGLGRDVKLLAEETRRDVRGLFAHEVTTETLRTFR